MDAPSPRRRFLPERESKTRIDLNPPPVHVTQPRASDIAEAQDVADSIAGSLRVPDVIAIVAAYAARTDARVALRIATGAHAESSATAPDGLTREASDYYRRLALELPSRDDADDALAPYAWDEYTTMCGAGTRVFYDANARIRKIAGPLTTVWYDAAGSAHRDGDLPAVEGVDGKEWYRHGERHREGDLPAVVRADGQREWWRNGVRHRADDLPAIVTGDGIEMYFVEGALHRARGRPAYVDHRDGDRVHEEYYVNDQLHRDGGEPALIEGDVRRFYQQGQLHRDDGPAFYVVGPDGWEGWYVHGRLHRDNDLPSVIHRRNGREVSWQWRDQGELHRTTGPAMISEFGTQVWYDHGDVVAPTPEQLRAWELRSRASGPRTAPAA